MTTGGWPLFATWTPGYRAPATPHATIRGRVTGDGEPVPDATVLAMTGGHVRGATHSDRGGRFVLAVDEIEGSVQVLAMHRALDLSGGAPAHLGDDAEITVEMGSGVPF